MDLWLEKKEGIPTAQEIVAFVHDKMQDYLDPNWQPYGKLF